MNGRGQLELESDVDCSIEAGQGHDCGRLLCDCRPKSPRYAKHAPSASDYCLLSGWSIACLVTVLELRQAAKSHLIHDK